MYQKETVREFQRRRSIELMEKGEDITVIARVLGLSPGTLYKWRKLHRNGDALKIMLPSGRRRRLSDDQLEELRSMLLRGATAYGWHNDLWTSKRVSQLIRRYFNIEFSRCHTWTILRKYLGWTVQKPIQQLRERDNIEIERWKVQDLPQIIDNIKQRRAYLVFIDESGFLLMPNLRRTFAPRGQPPIIKTADPHGRISVIGALTISPIQKQPHFVYHTLPDNANFNSESVVRFLEMIRKQLSGPFTVLWDAIPIHCSQLVDQYLEQHPNFVIERFPAYVPEFNPVDKVWLYLKYNRLPNYAPTSLDELRDRLTDELDNLRNKQKLLASCIRRVALGFAVKD
jgi:transposase